MHARIFIHIYRSLSREKVGRHRLSPAATPPKESISVDLQVWLKLVHHGFIPNETRAVGRKLGNADKFRQMQTHTGWVQRHSDMLHFWCG